MQPMRAQKFFPAVQASKAPVELLDIAVPIKDGKELDIIVPVTRREMVGAVASAAAGLTAGAAQAKVRGADSTDSKIAKPETMGGTSQGYAGLTAVKKGPV